MLPIRYFLLSILCLLSAFALRAQEAAAADSMKAALTKATTAEEKVRILDELSKVMMNVSLTEAEDYGKRLIAVAEESRNRQLMFKAYLSNGARNSFIASQKDYSDKAASFYNKALELARQNRMEKEAGAAQMHLSNLYLMISNNEKALSYATQAFSLISTLNDDSLRAESHNIYGQVYQAKNENILALRNYFSALRIAENIKNNPLIRNCYLYLSSFYNSIDDYDKAIDYMTEALNVLNKTTEKNVPYQRVIYTNSIGSMYASKKSYDIAIGYFEKSIRMADSLKFSTLKIPGYISLLNQYLRIDEPAKALAYMNSPSGASLKQYLTNFGMASIIDQAYGVIYTEMGRFDSAGIFLEKAKPFFENSNNNNNRIGFYGQLAWFYKKSGNKQKAIEYYLKVKEMSEQSGLLENVKKASQYLDTLYTQNGNPVLAGKYNAVYYQYKDSIDLLKREKELMQVEADNEQQREERLEKERQERLRQRHNIQYMAIIFGIVGLFFALVVLGMFKVSQGLIKAISFFVFLMLFEFVFLVFKKNIYSITHGEPWKDLAFMIALAALLVPLHHWLEHKALHYLTSHNRLTAAGHHIRRKLFGRAKEKEL
jgi:tetratricopeptide (TPR) repeat protein